jgi:hypothetical protein
VHISWSEPATTNASVQDEAVQAVLRMNQEHILFPCPRIFQPPFLLQNFPLVPTSTPSYLPHLISCSLHLQSLGELLSLSSTELRGGINIRLEEGGELNVEGIWRGESKRSASSKYRTKRKKVSSLPSFHFSFFYGFFFLCVFFSFLLVENKKMLGEST